MARISNLWRNLFRKARVERDLDEEMRGYVEMLVEEKVARGMAPAAARRAALVETGGLEQVKEEVRAVRAGVLLEQLAQDLRFGLRMLRKNPGFSVVAVLTIALGIGANAAIFTIFDSVVLRPLQLPESHRLVDVYQTIHGTRSRGMMGGFNLFSYAEFVHYRDENQVFTKIAAYKPETRVTLASTRQEITGELATCNYFEVVESRPALGRGFLESECAAADGGPVVVISDELWRNSFHADPAIVGKVIRLNRVPLTVIGVAAPDFHGTQIIPAQFWAPITMATSLARFGEKANILELPEVSWLAMLGRLKEGVSVRQARANLQVIAANIDRHAPGQTTQLTVDTATLFGRPDMRKVALGVGTVVLIAVGLVLLIACANIANLMLARAAARSQEIAVRLAVGASRARVVRQLLTESLLIAVIGGVAGLLVAAWTEPALVRLALSHIPDGGPWFAVGHVPDLRVIGYCLGLTVLTGVAFGLAPALQSTRPDLNCALKQVGAQAGADRGRHWMRSALVGAQVAVCMILLIAAGLLLRGLVHAQTIDPGFSLDEVGSVRYTLGPAGFTLERAAQFNRDMAERVRTLPGVEDVELAASAPLAGVHFGGGFTFPGHSENHQLTMNFVGARFFSLVGIPLVRGRSFTAAEVASGAPVLVVSETAARRLWPGQDPIGKQLKGGMKTGEIFEVIGVAKDVQIDEPGKSATSYVYMPAGPARQLDVMSVLVRTKGTFKDSEDAIRSAARAMDPEMKIDVGPLRDGLEEWVAPARISVALAAALGLLGLGLASIGIYGTAAYSVSRRTREIGIRMTLGAQAHDVMRLIVRQAIRPVVIGALVGMVLCAGVAQILRVLLYGLSTLDPVSFVGVPAFLLGVALLATYLPARRAIRIDPMAALRHD